MWESSSKHPEKGEWGEGSAVNVFAGQARGPAFGPPVPTFGAPTPGGSLASQKENGELRFCKTLPQEDCDSALWLPHTRAQGSAPMHPQAYIPPTHTSSKDGRN